MHALTEVEMGCFYKEMVMMIHETIGITTDGILDKGLIHLLEKDLLVVIWIEYLIPSIPPGGDVVNCIIETDS